MVTHYWKFFQPQDRMSPALPAIIHAIYLDGFGKKEGWSLDGIANSLKRSTIFGLLMDYNQLACGYALYYVPDVLLRGASMLWEDAVCLRRTVQAQGLATPLFKLACGMFPERKFGWIGGRTQNPIVIKRYAKWGTLFPFNTAYDSPDGQQVMEYLRRHIAEVREVRDLDAAHGVCRKIYRSGRLGDYPTKIDGMADIETKLAAWNFQRDQGDAMIVISKLFRPIQIPATEAEE